MGPKKAAGKTKALVNRLKKIEPRYYLSFFFALFLLCSGFFLLGGAAFASRNEKVLVQNGQLDLSAALLDEKNVFELAGDFYFQPDLLATDPDPEGAMLVSVPGVWNDYYGQDSSSAGFGTYQLQIKLPGPGLYALRSRTIRAAARVYLNGHLAAQMGEPARNMADFEPESKFLLGLVQVEDTGLDVVIQVANYGYGKGGILKPLEFGSADALLTRQRRELALELTMVVLFLSLGFFTLVIYLWRGRQPALLFFGLGSVFLGLYLATMNNQILSILLSYNFFTRLKIQISMMVLSALCFLLFVRAFFPKLASYKACRVFQGLLLLALLLGFNDQRWAFSVPIELVQLLVIIILALVYGYITWCLLKALWQKASASEYLLVVLAAVCTYWLLLFAKILFELELGHLPELYLVAAHFGTILLIGDRLHREYLLATRLTEERLEQELKYFFSQISPHFLYNTIGSRVKRALYEFGPIS
jgi:hypothetical protein